MTNVFPYQPGYIGELDTFSPEIASDLERLAVQLDPSLSGAIPQERLAYFRHDRHFRQFIVVEELDGRSAIVGTANISLLAHSYDSAGRLSTAPALFLGSFVVEERARGKGVATRLWNKLLEIGSEEGIHLMQFTSRPGRDAAHSFYAKLGAAQVTPLARLKVKADGTEQVVCEPPAFEQQFELAKGLIASLFSEKGADFVDIDTAKSILAKSHADYLEQIIPVAGPDTTTTTLFSVDF